MKTRIGILILLVLLVAVAPADAQSVMVKITGIDAGDFPRVKMFVSVTDAAGHAVQALGKEAFSILEEGRDAKIISINASKEPIHVGLVIDHSGSMGQQNKLIDAQTAANAFVDEMRPQDEAFVTMFDDVTDPLQDFTGDHAALKSAISKIVVRGGTAFYDAVYASAEKYAGRKEQRKNTLILLSDGLDNRDDYLQSVLGRGSKHTLDEAIAKSKELNIAVYTIGLGSDADQSRLQTLATQTGARFYSAPTGSQLKELYVLIAEQLQKEYVIEFNTPRALADGTQRHVKLSVQMPNGGTQTDSNLYVAGFLFNRIHSDWLVGALIGLILLTLGFMPSIVRYAARAGTPTPVPALPNQPGTLCPYCHKPVRVGARFCSHCRQPLGAQPTAMQTPVAQAARCPKCGNQVRQGAKFCGSCRYKLI